MMNSSSEPIPQSNNDLLHWLADIERADLWSQAALSAARNQPEYADAIERQAGSKFSGRTLENIRRQFEELHLEPGLERLFQESLANQTVVAVNTADGAQIATPLLTPMGQKTTVEWGLSNAFHNKTNLTGNDNAFSDSFARTETDVESLVQHVTTGGAWTPGCFTGNRRRKETWLQSEFLGQDFDENTSVSDLLQNPFVKQFALLIAPTASHTPEWARTRVVFRLDPPVTDIQECEALQAGLNTLYRHLVPDEKCEDASRLFFGSDVAGAYINLEAVLPVDTLKTLIADHQSHTAPVLKPAELKEVRLDSEVGRLSIALHLTAAMRVWAIARAIKEGQWSLEALWQELAVRGITYSDRHKRRILSEGEGVFWNIDWKMNQLYLIRPAATLTRRAKLLDPKLTHSNLPGLKRDVYVPISANLEEWEAYIYAGWLAAKKKSDISRIGLSKLFNRSKRTIIRWENNHLVGIIKITPNLVQTDQKPEDCNAPVHHYTYLVGGVGQVGAKSEDRTAWRLPNTYTSKSRVHKQNGQRKQMLCIAKNAAELQPSTEKGGGLPRNARQIFTNADKASKAASESNKAVKLVIGHTRTGTRKSELTMTGIPKTRALERIIPASEMQWYKEAKNA